MQINYKKITFDKLSAIVDLWNKELSNEFPITEKLFEQNSLIDENVFNQGSRIAVNEKDQVVGFIVAKKWQENLSIDLGKSIGWIQVLLVDHEYQNKGIGSTLLKTAEKALKDNGINKVLLGRDPWHYFPGIPNEYDHARSWFEYKGYVGGGTEFDLINDYNESEKEILPTPDKATFSLLTLEDKEPFLAFLHRCFPGRWEYEAIHYFKNGGTGREFVVLKKNNEIIGFSRINDAQSPVIAQNVYWSPLFNEELGGIGPLGVDAKERKQGYGLATVEAAIYFLRNRNINKIVIDWTGLVDFYKKLGYEKWKVYNSYQKEFN